MEVGSLYLPGEIIAAFLRGANGGGVGHHAAATDLWLHVVKVFPLVLLVGTVTLAGIAALVPGAIGVGVPIVAAVRVELGFVRRKGWRRHPCCGPYR